MYSIYLYCDDRYGRCSSQYGYWAGKFYKNKEYFYPVCEEINRDYLKRKEYIILKRAISSGKIIMDKCAFVTGFEVEDENGNILYEYQPYKVVDTKRKDIDIENIDEENSYVTVTQSTDQKLDMREKVKEYILELNQEIDRCVSWIEEHTDSEACQVAAMEMRAKTLGEVVNDLEGRLAELV